MLKFLLKIWPAFLPIMTYIFWVYVVEAVIIERLFRRKKIIEGEKVVNDKLGKFSLRNPCFVTVLYVSFGIAIFSLILAAFS
jgi:hypothetical protein